MELPELHADLFSRHASPLGVYVFVVVANRGEDVTSDEICRLVVANRGEDVMSDEMCRFNGKQQ